MRDTWAHRRHGGSRVSAGEDQVNQQGNAYHGGVHRGGDLWTVFEEQRHGRQAGEAGRSLKQGTSVAGSSAC